MNIILIPGLWLRAKSWVRVENELVQMGHRVQSLTLPGQDGQRMDATLQDQIDAVLEALDVTVGPTLVVGHSAGSALAWIAAECRPEQVTGVVMIGGMPVEAGRLYANFFPVVDGRMPFPGWAPFAGAASADLDEDTRTLIENDAMAVPQDVCHAVVALSDERRFNVPVTLVCPEYSPADAQEWIDEGFVPELSRAKRVTLVDIDSGHWPMLTKPQELAGVINAAAQRT